MNFILIWILILAAKSIVPLVTRKASSLKKDCITIFVHSVKILDLSLCKDVQAWRKIKSSHPTKFLKEI